MNEDVSHIEMDDFPASHVSFWGITVNDLFFKGGSKLIPKCTVALRDFPCEDPFERVG